MRNYKEKINLQAVEISARAKIIRYASLEFISRNVTTIKKA